MAAPHRLYGHVAADRRYSVGAWLADLAPVLEGSRAAGALPVLVGGTGLYFKALTEGPRADAADPRRRPRALGGAACSGRRGGSARPARRARSCTAAAIRPTDPQRILRALEVLEATGAPLDEWQKGRHTAPVLAAEGVVRIVMEPGPSGALPADRGALRPDASAGALDEVRALLQRELPMTLPVMKAIGVREIAAFLQDEIPLEEAAARAKTETRRYAKRQLTWFRNQMRDWQRIPA